MVEIDLEHVNGDREHFSFEKNSIMIGRAAGNDIRLQVNGVSRYHARLTVEDGGLVLQDLNSTNGTFVNSKQIERLKLDAKESFTIGGVKFLIHVTNGHQEKANGNKAKLLPVGLTYDGDFAIEDVFPIAELIPPSKDDEGTIENQMEISQKEEEPQPWLQSLSKLEDFNWQSFQAYFAPIWSYLVDDSVSEIMVNGPKEIFIIRAGKLQKVKSSFVEDQLEAAVLQIAKYAGKDFSDKLPFMDGSLPDGSRISVIMSPWSRKGISVTIRKSMLDALTPEDLMAREVLNKEILIFLRACVVLGKNILISGIAGSGKTVILGVLSKFIDQSDRVILVEGRAELQLDLPHILPIEMLPGHRSPATMRDLLHAAMNMSPKRVLIGDLQGDEAFELISIMSAGQSGCMTCLRALSPRQALSRLERLSMSGGAELPIRALREEIALGVDIIVHLSRLPNGMTRLLSISEVAGLREDGSYNIHDIFRFHRLSLKDNIVLGEHRLTGYIPNLLRDFEAAGIRDATTIFHQIDQAASPQNRN